MGRLEEQNATIKKFEEEAWRMRNYAEEFRGLTWTRHKIKNFVDFEENKGQEFCAFLKK